MSKPKLLFVYDVLDESMWKDGLYAAIELLKKDFDITRENLAHPQYQRAMYDFVLGWGGFGSSVDKYLQRQPYLHKGLCLGGYAPYQGQQYDILFYEVPEWSKNWLKEQDYKGKTMHAFGVNTDIYKPMHLPKVWKRLVVGAFAYWKRMDKILQKEGPRIAVGQIQDDNIVESSDIIGNLILGHCGVSDSVPAQQLAVMYNLSEIAYAPMDIFGGGERFVWEAKSCGIPVETEEDNPKLKELAGLAVKDHHWYALQLKEGILKLL